MPLFEHLNQSKLTFLVPILGEEKKLSYIYIHIFFTLLCGVSKGFMKTFKTFKAFIKLFDAPQKKCENKNLA